MTEELHDMAEDVPPFSDCDCADVCPEGNDCDLCDIGWYETMKSLKDSNTNKEGLIMGYPEDAGLMEERMSDTPRTDAAIAKYYLDDNDYVEAGFVRQLERELAAAQAEIARLKKTLEYNKDVSLMAPSEICHRYSLQNCHHCDRTDCCDNQSKAVKEIATLKAKLAAAEAGKVDLGKLADELDEFIHRLDPSERGIYDFVRNWKETK